MASRVPIGRYVARIGELAGVQYQGMVERVGQQDPFLVLVSTILSLRTKDELTEVKSRELWRHARSPKGMIRLGAKRISQIIYPVGFYRRKATQIVETSRMIIDDHNGRVPDTIEELVTFPGVGRKTANLVVTAGYGKPGICVDTHVHRIMNRWGYVETPNPDRTEIALRKKLPRRYWMEINSLLVFFGKNVCQPVSPRCSTCPLQKSCPAIGVTKHR